MDYDRPDRHQRLDTALQDPDLTTRLDQLRRSKVWQRMEEFLCLRREQLFAEAPTSTELLWCREGALREVHRLLFHGPRLVLQWQQWVQEHHRSAPAAEGGLGQVPPSPPPGDAPGLSRRKDPA